MSTVEDRGVSTPIKASSVIPDEMAQHSWQKYLFWSTEMRCLLVTVICRSVMSET